MKEDSASWYEQVRYRRERENKHWPSRMKLRARRSHIYSNVGGGRLARFRLVSVNRAASNAGVPSNGKNGLAQILRNAPPQIPYVAWSVLSGPRS